MSLRVFHSGAGDIKQYFKSEKNKNVDRGAASRSSILNCSMFSLSLSYYMIKKLEDQLKTLYHIKYTTKFFNEEQTRYVNWHTRIL